MRAAIERNHPSAVNHLMRDDQGAIVLEDLKIRVIGRSDHRWTLGSPCDATFRQAHALCAYRSFPAQLALCKLHGVLLAFRIQRRKPSVWWIEDQRSSMVGDALEVALVLPGPIIVMNVVLRLAVVLEAQPPDEVRFFRFRKEFFCPQS